MGRSNHRPRRSAGKTYRPGPVHANAVQMAINGARRLSTADVAVLTSAQEQAFLQFIAGKNCPQNWRNLADAANIAETLAGMNLGSGPEADRAVLNAQQALASAAERHAQRGTWTLYPAELEAMHWLLRLHTLQLQVCSYSEFCAALQTTERRVSQATLGNAAAGVLVVQMDAEGAQAHDPSSTQPPPPATPQPPPGKP